MHIWRLARCKSIDPGIAEFAESAHDFLAICQLFGCQCGWRFGGIRDDVRRKPGNSGWSVSTASKLDLWWLDLNVRVDLPEFPQNCNAHEVPFLGRLKPRFATAFYSIDQRLLIRELS